MLQGCVGQDNQHVIILYGRVGHDGQHVTLQGRIGYEGQHGIGPCGA